MQIFQWRNFQRFLCQKRAHSWLPLHCLSSEPRGLGGVDMGRDDLSDAVAWLPGIEHETFGRPSRCAATSAMALLPMVIAVKENDECGCGKLLRMSV